MEQTPESTSEQDQAQKASEQLRLEAKAAFEANDFEKVIQLFSQAVQADPNNFQVHLDLARMYFQTGNLEKSIELFNKLPEEAQLSAEGKTLNLFLICAEIVSQSPSLEEIQIALEQDHNDADMLYSLTGYLMINHGYEEAIKTLLKLFISYNNLN